jgi:transcriptional regulator with XRE-family HTH domain
MKLLRWRREKGLTAAQVGDFLGITRVAVRNYERGLRRPSSCMMEKICDLTDGRVTSHDFSEGENASN